MRSGNSDQKPLDSRPFSHKIPRMTSPLKSVPVLAWVCRYSIRARPFYLTIAALIACAPGVQGQAIFSQFFGTPRTDGGKVVGITLNSFGQTINSLGFYDSGDGLATS